MINLFSQKTSMSGIKLSLEEKTRKKQLRRAMKPSSQNTIRYTSLFEDGLMHVANETYSKTYHLGDTNYITATEKTRSDIIDYYAYCLNGLDPENHYQLLILNRPVPSSMLKNITYELQGDAYDVYRKEYNEIISSRFATDQNNFNVEKFITVSSCSRDRKQAYRNLNDVQKSFESQFQTIDVPIRPLDGTERLNIFSDLLRDNPYLDVNYQDVALSGLTTKSFIAPGRFEFSRDHMLLNKRFAQVLYARDYPSFLNDKLIKSLTDIGIELAISIHAQPKDISTALKAINTAEAGAEMDTIKAQSKAAQKGVSSDLAGSGKAKAISEEAKKWKDEINQNDQKIFSGAIQVFVKADSQEELDEFSNRIKSAGRKHMVEFEEAYYHQEEGLNAILPIGVNYLDVKSAFIKPVRDYTTANLATQIPFTNVDLQSESSLAVYYGQNQISNNIITVDRQRDLNTASGVVIGSSGSGKSFTVKGEEVIPSLLKHTKDRIIIVDPEEEYTGIGRAFGAQIVDIYPGSSTHLNLLDLPDPDKLSGNEDPIGQKSSLIMGLFENILEEISDGEVSLIDRVTELVYEEVTDRPPTLKDWHRIMLEQEEEEAQELALKVESYTSGSQDIFAYETNVDISNRFVIFNLKKLSGKLKPFALMVVQDYIWNQVVDNQGKLTTRLFFDEMQYQFQTDNQAAFFTDLYARVRKYGAIPTGITQHPETLLERSEGRKLLQNSEFIILLKQKPDALEQLKSTISSLTPELEKYVLKPKAKGTGLIIAGDTVVPFENPIPKNTKLFKLLETDAYTSV